MKKRKFLTRSEAEAKRRRAVQFLLCIGQPESAERFEAMSPREYAERKGMEFRENPRLRRLNNMAGKSRADLQAEIDELESYTEELEEKLDEINELSADADDSEDEEDLDLADAEEDE